MGLPAEHPEARALTGSRAEVRRTRTWGGVAGGLALILLAVGLFCLTADRPSPAEADTSELELVYVSDYLSFVGHDDEGHVAFALDTNRGRDGETWQAEHFVVLHDEPRGWVDLKGGGPYQNHQKTLLKLPDSPAFTFEGTPATGLTVRSAVNDLSLQVSPLPGLLTRSHEEGRMVMGSASAVLTWRGRRLEGRVIYEYLYLPDFNRLTRTYWDLWKKYQGLYALVEPAAESGAREPGDFYLHSQRSPRLTPLVAERAGFLVLGERSEVLQDPQWRILARNLALGFYRWPMAWEGSWSGRHGFGSVSLALTDRKVFGNWLIGGFAMGVVRGELTYDGRTYPVYGLAELIM